MLLNSGGCVLYVALLIGVEILFFLNYNVEVTWCGRAFHHYRHQKDPIKKQQDLERLLLEEYRTLDDFRTKERANTAKEEGH